MGGFGSLSSGLGVVHTDCDGSVFGDKSPSATSASKTAVVAVDLPHGAGSANCAIASTEGECGEWAPTKAKVCSLLFFFLSLFGSGFRMQARRREQTRQRQMAR